jgi:acetate kinase
MTKRQSIKPAQTNILAINGGSSSIKFALFLNGNPMKRLIHGSIERIGLPGTNLTFSDSTRNRKGKLIPESSDNWSASNFLIDWLEEKIDFSSIFGIGHRVVFGLKYTGPERVTQNLLKELHSLSMFDSDHLPAEIKLIEAFRIRYPKLPQVACFDTAFHYTMPRVAKLLPIPRRFEAMGIRRYGFHGLSYAFLMEELAREAGNKAAQGRVILAHLGNGASMAAIRNGKSIDTSMGFTPAGGLVMGSRPGDLDPGVAWFMIKSEKLTPQKFNYLINHDCGLIGISETSSDMQDLLAKEKNDVRAAEAIALFCYQAKKRIGSFAAALGGLDTLVFAGGIGENCPVVRTRICEGLGFLGIELENKRNFANAPVISTEDGKVTVRVIHTDEEYMIGGTIREILGPCKKNQKSKLKKRKE